ncbi:MAG: 6,7-dimethyl-8-ribityllumazine synthase [Burkholderiaceae bacterium]
MDIDILRAELDGEGLSIGIVQSRFNESVTNGLRDACVAELLALGVSADDIVICSVPGALEIPAALQSLARQQTFDALIALGAVIRGETYHFEIVSNESAAGIARVGLDFGVIIANGVLTTESDEQAMERVAEKGADAARAAVEMSNLTDLIDEIGDDVDTEDE